MKFSLKWLRDYCPTNLRAEQLAEALTMFGQEVEEIHASDDDVVLEVEVVPNRPDCLSFVGMAREVSYVARAPLILPPVFLKEASAGTGPALSIDVEDADLCPRYVGRVVTGIKVEPSPTWLAERLLAAGVRPLNNVVDVTNFVNLETGQPLHAFDLARLRGRRIIVRRAKAGEKITLLDDREVELDNEVLAICDAEGPVALAGIMGGKGTEVTTATEGILIESAYFEPRGIRRTARRFGITTESSYRFERGVDPQAAAAAADRAAALLVEITGGAALAPLFDVGQSEWPRRALILRPQRANAVIGTSLSGEEMAVILRHLYFEVGLDRMENLVVSVPSWRRDVAAEIDLVEELARAHGYDALQPTLPGGRLPEPRRNNRESFERDARDVLKAAGFTEVYTPSFTNAQQLKTWGMDPAAAPPLVNPVANQFSLMRPALWPLLADTAQRNGLNGAPGALLFEIGKVFAPADEGAVEERLHLAMVAAGETQPRRWGRGVETADAFFVKGAVECLARAFVVATDWQENNVRVGNAVGRYAVTAVEPFGSGHVVELDVTQLASEYAGPQRQYVSLSRFPAITRDLALVLDEAVPAGDVSASVASSHELVRAVDIFDVFTGAGLSPGKKNLGVRVVYRADDRTLTDDEANAASQAAVKMLTEKFGAVLRG